MIKLKNLKKKGLEYFDLSLLTDGLKDEREQGITIDVAYRYFATPKRKFIIADTPGHIQYTRNMVTGASSANLALILVDVRKGVIEQTKRHSIIASLLKIPHLIVCVNKMDLVDFDEEKFNNIVNEFSSFSSKLDIKDIRFVPVSALKGDNVVKQGSNLKWFNGGTLLHNLETIHISSDQNLIDYRYPIQNVIRPHGKKYHDFRGYAGRIASGVFKKNDDIIIMPSGLKSTISKIYLAENEVDEAYPPQSVTITLKDDIDISRGDMIVRADNRPSISQEIDVMLCWLSHKSPRPRANILLGTQPQKSEELSMKLNIRWILTHFIELNQIFRILKMNDIARVKIKCTKPLFFDSYSNNRITGSLVMIDEITNETIAAGMIR